MYALALRAAAANRSGARPGSSAIGRSGWREQQILVVSPSEERLDWVERELVKRIGGRLYGRPGGRRVGS